MRRSLGWPLLALLSCIHIGARAHSTEGLRNDDSTVPPVLTPLQDEPQAHVAQNSVGWFLETNKEFHSAVLIAGTSGMENYRHQADVCHAYKLLKERGLKDENIITFVYDDLAYHPYNPYKGRIYNSPSKPTQSTRVAIHDAVIGGPDVYPGCAKDYTGINVNRETIVSVLKGDAGAVSGIGSGRVLKRNPNQRVFLFYSGHGVPGYLDMPVGGGLSARHLYSTFTNMLNANSFKELVFYLEACYAGTIFAGFGYQYVPKILPVAASRAGESSYSTYIHRPRFYPPFHLGDLFSVSWMEYAEAHDGAVFTIKDQLQYTTLRTSVDHTYKGGSHVTLYTKPGNSIMKQVFGNFLSYFDVPSGKTKLDADPSNLVQEEEERSESVDEEYDQSMNMQQSDATLMYFEQLATSNDLAIRDSGTKKLQQILNRRQESDLAIRAIAKKLRDGGLLSTQFDGVEDYAKTLLDREENRQLVDDWDCFEDAVHLWNDVCGAVDEYSMKYTTAFANFCNAGIKITDIAEAVTQVCAMDTLVV